MSEEEKMAYFVVEMENGTRLIEQSKIFIEQDVYNPVLESPTAGVDNS